MFIPIKPTIQGNAITEAQKRETPEQVDKKKREKLKMASDTAKEMMKSKPAKKQYYAAKMKYIEAQIKVLDAYKTMLNAKG